MTLIAVVLGSMLAAYTVRRELVTQARVRRQPARAIPALHLPVAVGVREPEPFWFPEPPACSLDEGRAVLVHIAPAYPDDVGEVLEFPIGKGWDVESIATTLAEIESL